MEFQKNMLALGLIAGLTACGQDKQASNSRRGQGADLTQALDCREAMAKAPPGQRSCRLVLKITPAVPLLCRLLRER